MSEWGTSHQNTHVLLQSEQVIGITVANALPRTIIFNNFPSVLRRATLLDQPAGPVSTCICFIEHSYPYGVPVVTGDGWVWQFHSHLVCVVVLIST